MAETHQTLLNGKPLSCYDKDGLELKTKKHWKKGKAVFAIVYIIALIVAYWFMPALTYLPEDIWQCQCEVRVIHKEWPEDVNLIRNNLENWREIGDFREFYMGDNLHYHSDVFSRVGTRVSYDVYVSMGEMYERCDHLSMPEKTAELDPLQELIKRNSPYTDSELLDIVFIPAHAEVLQSLLSDLEKDQFAVGVQFTFKWVAEGDSGTDQFYAFAINDQGLSFAEAAQLLQIVLYVIVAIAGLVLLALIAGMIKFIGGMSEQLAMDDDDYYNDDEDDDKDDDYYDEDEEEYDDEEDEEDE